MRKIVSLALLLTPILGAQAWKEYHLPNPINFKGIVVDQNGQPVPDVRIDHTDEMRILRRTDAKGAFDFEAIVPAVVFRKEGYQSVFVRTDSSNLRIVMIGSPAAEFPACPAGAKVDSISGWDAFFAFPKIKGVTASGPAQDIDYGARSYSIGSGKGARAIMHGSGPMWDFGMPPEANVWRSVQYQETTLTKDKISVTSASGQFNDGNRWRYLGRFGESASYSDVEPATADILDKLLDGACWKNQTAK